MRLSEIKNVEAGRARTDRLASNAKLAGIKAKQLKMQADASRDRMKLKQAEDDFAADAIVKPQGNIKPYS